MATFPAIDFNSFSGLQNGTISLSDYYIDYAFEGESPTDGMDITFYDEQWLANSDDAICFDAILRKPAATLNPGLSS